MPRTGFQQPARGRRGTPTGSELHRAWLELVDQDGPFLAVPALKRVWPQGITPLAETARGIERKATLLMARKDFESAWETFDRTTSGGDEALESYRIVRDKWVEAVLRDVVGWAESFTWGDVPGVQAHSPNHAVTITAQAALQGPDSIGALVRVIDPVDSLRQTPGDQWAATPIDRMAVLLRESGVPIGVVTDGRWWGLVCAREGAMVASGIVDALTWSEQASAATRDAFLTILGRKYLVGGEEADRLPELFRESVAAAEEITEALGSQVRSAVELLIQSFSESAVEAKRHGLDSPLPADTHATYEAAVTVMMRVVFLLFAEERGLLPTGELFEQGYGIASELDELERREAADGEESLDDTSLSWHRLLATSRALFAGASFEGLRMPAYGGSLFDPSRFPFLTEIAEHGSLAITVSDRVMLHVLRSVQEADVKGGKRRITFRDIDVEQIGYIYEGLLGYTAVAVDEIYLGLTGTKGVEPELPLATLEELDEEHFDDDKALAAAIRERVAETQPSATPSSVAAYSKGLRSNVDPAVESALARAVGDDDDLRLRVAPWLGIIRTDLRNYPFVVLPGGLMVKETPSRKNAGAHYTPKSLAEEVVLYALQPLCYAPGPHQTADESAWTLKSSSDLLDLKVADIACGSGAFLVAAARYLADRLVEAWVAEDPSNAERKDLHTRAIRQVVANCLYGADINGMAVEMCKLSLWLVSLDRDLPFSFVDDKIFHGNSLLGLTSLDQLNRLHIDPNRVSTQQMLDVFAVDVDGIVHRATELRRTLASPVDDDDPARSSSAKKRQLAEFRQVTAQLRKLADGVIAAGLPLGGKPGKKLDEAYENLRIAAKQAEHGDPAMLDRLVDTGLTPTVETDYHRWQPLHWVLEAPDVIIDHGGFDAVIGNPPFLGGKKISIANGPEVRDWITNVLAGGAAGSADLVSYFFLRAQCLLSPSRILPKIDQLISRMSCGHLQEGMVALIATDTIAQGDTREVGLDQMIEAGFKITRSVQSRPWPSNSAAIRFAAVWGTIGEVSKGVSRSADGVLVPRISSLLEPAGRASGVPMALHENSGLCHIGCYVMGTGFVLASDEAEAWIASDASIGEVVHPYLSGFDLNQRPDCSATRWVIDFSSMSEVEATQFVKPFERVRTLVKPERVKNKRRQYRDRWWQFGEPQRAMREAVKGLQQVLAIALVSKTVMPVRVSTRQIPNHKLGVIASQSYGIQAILSSSIHQLWAIKWSSTQGDGVNYSPTDVFVTFPRHDPTDWLERVGRTLDEERREIMLRRELGLTDLYNLVNDPAVADASGADVARMREIHAELDRAVMEAYGWSDVPLGHGFHTYRQMVRWTVSPAARVEILDRLLEENHRRAALEKAAGPAPRPKRPTKRPTTQDGLFG